MSAPPQVLASLRRWDDDAWVAVSSRGLVRRADRLVAEHPPSLGEADGDAVVVLVGGQVVRLDAQGPASASCTCPAPGVCQHVVAAGRWLAASPSGEVVGPNPVDELLGLSDDDLVAHAGRDELREARRLLAGLDPGEVRVEIGDHEVAVALDRPAVRFRYLGGGVTGLLTDTRSPHLPRLRCAAVLAVHRAAGRPVDLPPPATDRTIDPERHRRLLAMVRDALIDLVRIGLAHPSPGLEERFRSLAVGAQGAGLARLDRALRRLADQVAQALGRTVLADTDTLLTEAALALALTVALQGDPTSGRLAGRAREAYDEVRPLRLIGLGGLPWRTASGYAGLTCLFWWPDEQRFVSWTDARGQTGGLDPRSRWTASGPWTGVPNPAATSGRVVRLADARVSSSGRVSGVERTSASLAPLTTADLAGLPSRATWAAASGPPRSLLDGPDPLRDWVVLRPVAVHPPTFDELRQVAMRMAEDAAGDLLPLEVRWTPEQAHAVHRLESLVLGEGALVVARVATGSGRRVALPLSVVGQDATVDALHFDGDGGSVPPPTGASPDEVEQITVPVLASLHSWLRDAAERGTGADRGELIAELTRRHAVARSRGLTLLPAVPEGDPAELVLRTTYLLLQAEAVARDLG